MKTVPRLVTVSFLMSIFSIIGSNGGGWCDETPLAGRPDPGVEAVADIGSLPILRHGSIARQVSSHDKTGGNSDGFFSNSELYVDGNGEYVLFDDYGPGCIYRIWFATYRSWRSRIRIYVDDMNSPVVNAGFLDFFRGKVPPFSSPLVDFYKQSSGGFVCYLPICYEQRAKITLSRSPEFYNIAWRRYDLDRPVTSFTGLEDYSELRQQWNDPTADPKRPAAVRTTSGSFAIPAGGSVRIADESGSGAIWNLWLDVSPLTLSATSNLWIRARWDGHSVADVEAPVNEFFGSYNPQRICRGLLLGHDGQRYYCNLPMPFGSDAVIDLENRGTAPVSVETEYERLLSPYPVDAGTFRTIRSSESPTTRNRDYNLATLEGAGHYVGVTYTMIGPWSGSYLEGDERFHLDDALSPSIYGTGTEDYFNAAWYFLYGVFSRPLHGCTERLQPVGSRKRTGCYRLHLGDLVPFFRSARLGIEHDGSNGNTNDTHASVAYFYVKPGPGLSKTDELEPGDPASELLHGYTQGTPPHVPTGTIHSFYEGDDDTVAVQDAGYAVASSSTFTMTLDPGNRGVLLRRRLDQATGRQHARVFVDDVFAGTWYDVFENPHLRWADSDLPLPASLTAGKSTIVLRVENAGSVPWTEFLYSVWCYE